MYVCIKLHMYFLNYICKKNYIIPDSYFKINNGIKFFNFEEIFYALYRSMYFS